MDERSPLADDAGFDALTRGSAAILRPRDVVVATGPDAVTFLHSQLSQDVAGLPIGASAWSFHLQPQGKVIALLRVTRIGEHELRLDTDPGAGSGVLQALARFKIRTKCDLHLYPDVPSLAVRGDGAPAAVASWHAERASRREEPASGDLRGPAGEWPVPTHWPGWPGFDLFCPLPADPAAMAQFGSVPLPEVARVTDRAYEAARIVNGELRFAAEITDATIPSETGLVGVAVSFTKGCYVGQELVERIDARGRAVRLLRLLEFASASPVTPGAALRSADAPSDTPPRAGASAGAEPAAKAVGTVTSWTLHPVQGRGIALAYVRHDVLPGSRVVAGPGGPVAEVRARRPVISWLGHPPAGAAGGTSGSVPTAKRFRRGAVLVVAGAVSLSACSDGLGRDLPPPPSTRPLRPTSSVVTIPPLHAASLPVLEGTTTSAAVAVGPGRVTLRGSVRDGKGRPVPDAVVHFERLVGPGVGVLDVRTVADGTFEAKDVLAGRIRVRAWRTPDFVQIENQVLFATDGLSLDLVVEEHTGPRYRWAIAPTEAYQGQYVNVVLQVAQLMVTAEGVKTVQPVPEIPVTLSSDGPLTVGDTPTVPTDDDGLVRFSLRCESIGSSLLTATLATGETTSTGPFDCDAPPTTPPTTPPSTVPPTEPPTTAVFEPPTSESPSTLPPDAGSSPGVTPPEVTAPPPVLPPPESVVP